MEKARRGGGNQGWLRFLACPHYYFPMCCLSSPSSLSPPRRGGKDFLLLCLRKPSLHRSPVQNFSLTDAPCGLSLDSWTAASRIPIEFSKDPKDEQREYHGVRNPLAPFFVRERSFRVDGDGGRERIIHGRVRQRPRLAASNLATRLIGFRPIRKVHGESRPRPGHTPLSLPAVILAAAIYIN